MRQFVRKALLPLVVSAAALAGAFFAASGAVAEPERDAQSVVALLETDIGWS
ncbi:hypothetical protein [Kitasatospora sp. NPDC057500]|uniref:hypothetical protein n=1 Tax=Kitasatospora sp. NPDC057500 TaxID=3346151 RepID=UPI00368B024F